MAIRLPKQAPALLGSSATRIVAYLNGLYPDGHLRRAKINALRERWLSSPAYLAGRIETTVREREEVAPVLWTPSGVDAKHFRGEL